MSSNSGRRPTGRRLILAPALPLALGAWLLLTQEPSGPPDATNGRAQPVGDPPAAAISPAPVEASPAAPTAPPGSGAAAGGDVWGLAGTPSGVGDPLSAADAQAVSVTASDPIDIGPYLDAEDPLAWTLDEAGDPVDIGPPLDPFASERP